MNKTILITGTSSGIGRASVKYFNQKGWNVVATMRNPEKEQEFKKLTNVLCLALDVTKPETIKLAIQKAIVHFGGIDVIVNNAGYGLSGPFELANQDQINKQFETNVFGAMSLIREVLPYFRKRKQGTIINVTSMGGRLTVPLYSVYHGTKWALDGFSESLQYELLPFNIKVKIIEPGAIKTDFYDRSADVAANTEISEYDSYVTKAMKNMNESGQSGSTPELVASSIYKAATDRSYKLRYPVGMDAKGLFFLRWLLPINTFMKIVRSQVLK